jgi:hypothetical protein
MTIQTTCKQPTGGAMGKRINSNGLTYDMSGTGPPHFIGEGLPSDSDCVPTDENEGLDNYK